jgi:phosphotransferase system enzyme I (PtsP)
LCGELASKPIGALVLIALGFRSLSVTASSIGPVKAMIVDLHVARIERLVLPLLDSRCSAPVLRQKLEEFASAEGLQL